MDKIRTLLIDAGCPEDIATLGAEWAQESPSGHDPSQAWMEHEEALRDAVGTFYAVMILDVLADYSAPNL